MNPKGYVLCKQEFEHTTNWPGDQITLSGPVDLEKHYKEALAGKMCLVVDIARDESGYLLYAESEAVGEFLWMVEKEDTVEGSFLPVVKKYGILMPAELSPIEEFEYLATMKMQGAL